MINRKTLAAIAAILLAAPGVAQAECTGPNCYAGLEAMIGSVTVYALLGIGLLVLLVMRKWRLIKWVYGPILALTIGLPLLSQTSQGWKVWRMEWREVVGSPPPLFSGTPLLVASKNRCYFGACEAILRAAGPKGIIVLPLEVLEGLDLSAPVNLASLPLQNWAEPRQQGDNIDSRYLSTIRTAEIAPRIDYLIYVQPGSFASTQGPVDLALAGNPAQSGMGGAEVVRFAMAPLPPGTGMLSLQSLQFDLLDMWMGDEPLGLPLAPLNRLSANNRNPTADAAIRAICPIAYDVPEYDCVDGLQ